MSLIAELKHRNVFRVGAAYLALAWIVTQITGTVAPAFGLPEWTLKFVVWIGLIGFPFVIVFSWAYELTPQGLKRESEIDRSQSITHATGQRLDYLVIGLLVMAIGLFLFGQFLAAPVSGPAALADRTQGALLPEAGPARDDSVGAGPARDDSVGAGPARDDSVGAGPARDSSSAENRAQSALLPADDKSIAVLPFVNMSSDKEQEYFSDGIAEELLNMLAKVPGLRVIGRTSSFSYKGKDTKLAEVARELNVAHILEGSVRNSGSRVRITAQLVRASDSSHLWSETYDRKLDDIFAVQDEIAGAVVTQLKIALLGAAPKTTHQADPAVYAQFLKARQLRASSSVETRRAALAILDEVLATDPAYAEAWVEQAMDQWGLASEGALEIAQGARLAREALAKALALDPDLASAHSTLGKIAWEYDGDATEAARHVERALALAAVDSGTLYDAANLSLGLGRFDTALALTRFAQQRDPLNPMAHRMLSYVALYSGEYDESIAARRAALTLDTQGGTGNSYYIGLNLLLQGHTEQALAKFREESGTVWRLLGLALGCHATGAHGESDAALAELADKHAAGWAYNIAYVHAYRKEADQAFEWLDKAVANKDPGLSDVAADPLFAGIHSDPRWLPFLRKLGRAPEQLAAISFDVKLP